VCGCGVADIDSDSDGTLNCNDGCSSDPNKTVAGICGCGVADTDSDGDGTLDCQDSCANDGNKIAAGICGCGIADIDTDGDGTMDCNDSCINDPDKTTAGHCGCGVADTDADSDGTPDCIDECPSDGDKALEGVCGCEVSDTDSDGDGTPDCSDLCETDPGKTTPGFCGCGVSDVDADGDGQPDCQDLCPADPTKSAPGSCGCGEVDEDLDSDGIADCIDNCPLDANSDQGDGDTDGIGDFCDNCPVDANEDQADDDEDGIGDLCEVPVVSHFDFDNDGLSDILGSNNAGLIDSRSLRTLSSGEFDIHFTGTGETKHFLLPENGFEAHGEYTGDGFWDLAIASSVPEGLLWSILNVRTGEITRLMFGDSDAIPLAGCDFDGDSISDLAYVSSARQSVTYQRSLDTATITLPFSGRKAFEKISCGDVDGDGLDELLVYTSNSRKVFLSPIPDNNASNRARKKKKGKKKKGKKKGSKNGAGKVGKTTKRTVVAAFRADTGIKLHQVRASKISNLIIADLNGDGIREAAFLKSTGKGETSVFFILTGQPPIKINLPSHIALSVGQMTNSAGAIVDGLFLQTSDGTVHQFDFTDLQAHPMHSLPVGQTISQANVPVER
jgi:hypothetical protein